MCIFSSKNISIIDKKKGSLSVSGTILPFKYYLLNRRVPNGFCEKKMSLMDVQGRAFLKRKVPTLQVGPLDAINAQTYGFIFVTQTAFSTSAFPRKRSVYYDCYNLVQMDRFFLPAHATLLCVTRSLFPASALISLGISLQFPSRMFKNFSI